MFQLQEYNPILVPDEWCCTSRVLAWESHWHQLCIWPAIVQIVGFYSKKNAWDIWKLIYSGTGGCISDERKGMILHLVVITCIHTCIFYFMTSVVIIYRYHWKLRQHCILLSYFKTISVGVVWAQTPDLKHGRPEISNWANQAVVILLTSLIRHIQQLLELSTFWFCYFYFQKKFIFKTWTSIICEAGRGLSINFVV